MIRNHLSLRQVVLTLFTILLVLPLMSQTLREQAEKKGVYIGNIMNNQLLQNNNLDNGIPARILGEDFNVLVTENALKMQSLIPNRPSNPFNIKQSDLNLGGINNFVKFARARNMRTRGHAMIWYSQAPNWLIQDAKRWSAQQIKDFTKSYIHAIGTYCKGKIDEWDVVNEMHKSAYNATGYRKKGSDGADVWYKNLSTSSNDNTYNAAIYNYIKDCFLWAREVDDEAELFYNDFSIGSLDWAKSQNVLKMSQDLTRDKAPIDGVGLQSHLTTANFGQNVTSGYVRNIREYAKIGMQVHLTELDIRGGSWSGNDSYNGYYDLISKSLAEPNCNMVLVWGIRDNDSWIPGHFSGENAFLLYNNSYQKKGNRNNSNLTKGTWTGMLDGIGAKANAAFPPAVLTGKGNPGGGNTGGTNGLDVITSVTAPNTIVSGASATVQVVYKASANRDVLVVFQLDQDPWTAYVTVKRNVNEGSGTLNIPVPTGQAPIANNAYQYQVILTTNGGTWNTKLANEAKINVSVTRAVTPPDGQAIANGTYYMKKSTSNTYLQATARVGNTTSVSGTSSGNAVKWTFRHLGNEEYEIKNVAYDAKLEIANGVKGARSRVATTSYTGTAPHLVWVAVKVGNNFQFLPKHDQANALDLWQGNSIVQLWGKNTNNANQVIRLVSANTARKTSLATISEAAYSLYPNPTQGILNLSIPAGVQQLVKISNILGQVMYKNIVSSDSELVVPIDVSQFESGIYMLNINTTSLRFIKN